MLATHDCLAEGLKSLLDRQRRPDLVASQHGERTNIVRVRRKAAASAVGHGSDRSFTRSSKSAPSPTRARTLGW